MLMLLLPTFCLFLQLLVVTRFYSKTNQSENVISGSENIYFNVFLTIFLLIITIKDFPLICQNS